MITAVRLQKPSNCVSTFYSHNTCYTTKSKDFSAVYGYSMFMEDKTKNKHLFCSFNQIPVVKKLFPILCWFSELLVSDWSRGGEEFGLPGKCAPVACTACLGEPQHHQNRD